MEFNGIVGGMADLTRLSNARSRSISAENPTGEPGMGARCELEQGSAREAARDLGKGWKVNPYVVIPPGETKELANIQGPGVIQHIWMVPTSKGRNSIIRFYWDGQETPAVECPVGDFFASTWDHPVQLTSLAVCINPGIAYNCYWQMPFRKSCRITLEDIGPENVMCYYQIDYALTEIPEDAAYFHAQFRRVNPLPYKSDYTILDGVRGQGHYVGTYLAWGVNNGGWWGEGEIKFYLDGDREYPSICYTGTEDYFGGAYGFGNDIYLKRYHTYSGLYAGMFAILGDNSAFYNGQQRFLLYRFHVPDPIHFETGFRMTLDNLGWTGPRYDDYTSVAFWYQTLPHEPLKLLPQDADMVMK